MRGDKISTVGDNISTVEGIHYRGGILSVRWGDNSSTCGDSFSTVGDPFSTVEVVQYSGGYHQYSRWIASVLWRVFSTLGDNISTCGDNISTVGITSVL